ncbi:MAG: hypothetical protein GF308_15720 [Candidatus Heimdallarchaeota archaeon]|nr:hypothetical protein [Candidatus Heimdallarchaeota archaeon]
MSRSSSKGKRVRRRDLIVLYPAYFDKNLSRKMGRRVPLKLAYDDPDIRRIAIAAKKLGYQVFLDSDKHYPRTWYKKKGRVLIGKEDSKEEQIRAIAKLLPKVNVPKTAADIRREQAEQKKDQKKPRKGVYRQKKH